ncbi:MAG: glycosyltransferase [Opitutales bacterium]
MLFSVAICTYNPRPDYLARVLAALRAQTLPVSQWELLLIDNASTTTTARETDLTWHPAARLISEPTPGVIHARLRSIAEAAGEILVFVDDDNILVPNYLEEAARIGRDCPFLGAWGAGNIAAEFETPPPAWTEQFSSQLAICSCTRDNWANTLGPGNTPIGAGLCTRLPLARAHVRDLQAHPARLAMGRTGSPLTSASTVSSSPVTPTQPRKGIVIGGEDIDLVITVIELGHGLGRFASLRLTHLISANRLTEPYLCRLAEAQSYTEAWLFHHRNYPLSTEPNSFFHRLARWRYERTLDPRIRHVLEAVRRGRALALEEIARLPAA